MVIESEADIYTGTDRVFLVISIGLIGIALEVPVVKRARDFGPELVAKSRTDEFQIISTGRVAKQDVAVAYIDINIGFWRKRPIYEHTDAVLTDIGAISEIVGTEKKAALAAYGTRVPGVPKDIQHDSCFCRIPGDARVRPLFQKRLIGEGIDRIKQGSRQAPLSDQCIDDLRAQNRIGNTCA